jgi:RNA polymerase primary sigma factor
MAKISKKKVPSAGERSLLSNAVRWYLSKIGSIKLLSAAEEKELAQKVAQKDKEARTRFITANLRLVVNIAKKYIGHGVPFLDLIEEGNTGLIKAVEKFDYRKGYRFSTFATWWIKQAVLKALNEQSRLVKIPASTLEQIMKRIKVTQNFLSRKARLPTSKELARAMKLPVSKIEALDDMFFEVISLDKAAETKTPIGVLENTHELPEEKVYTQLKHELLERLLRYLNKREQNIIRARFGLVDGVPKTLTKVGKDFGLTRERIRQIEDAALKKLRRIILSRDIFLPKIIPK